MRAFLAVDVNEELLEKIGEVQNKLAKAEAAVKFVEPENLHFTFKFFGDISREKADEIIGMISEKTKKYSPFEVSIKGVGVFPHLGYIRVLWLGVEDSDQFSKMQMDFDEEFIKMGFKKERSYIPHLTIGRVKEIGKTTIKNLVLKESELTPAGPIYTDVKEFQL
jgi:2'-5' RNA ligase